MLEIWDVFSSVWVMMYRHSKSACLQVTLDFELEYMNISKAKVEILTQILLTISLSTDHFSKCKN